MPHSKLSYRNACAIVILIQLSNSVILGFPPGSGTDTWIAMLLSLVAVVPLMLLYGRLVKLMPQKNLYEMLHETFGRFAAVAISAAYLCYFGALTAIVRGNYAEFVHMSALENTPLIIICLLLLVASGYLAHSGIVALGKWSKIILAVAMIAILVVLLFSLPQLSLENLLPVFGHSPREIATTSLRFLALPVGEIVMVLTLMEPLDEKANPYKIFTYSSLWSTGVFILLFWLTCGVLGGDTIENAYFPTYKAISVLHIGTIGTRVESIVTFFFMMVSFSKVAAGIIACAKSISYIARLPSHRPAILPIAFFSAAFSVIAFKNITEMFDYGTTYRFYAPFFQIIVPLAMWAVAEVKSRRRKQADIKTLPTDPAAY